MNFISPQRAAIKSIDFCRASACTDARYWCSNSVHLSVRPSVTFRYSVETA